MHEIAIRIADEFVPTLDQHKTRINERWLPKANVIVAENPYTEQNFLDAIDSMQRYEQYLFVTDVLGNIVKQSLYTPSQLTNMSVFKTEFEASPTSLEEYTLSKSIWETNKKVKWANKVIALSNKTDQELTDDIDIKRAYAYKEDDIIFVSTPALSANMWNQMLARGRCTQEQYDNAQVSPGIFKWPWGEAEKRNQGIFIIGDDLTDDEVTAIGSFERDGTTVTNKRKYRLDKSFLSSETVDILNNTALVVEPRYDKPLTKDRIIEKI